MEDKKLPDSNAKDKTQVDDKDPVINEIYSEHAADEMDTVFSVAEGSDELDNKSVVKYSQASAEEVANELFAEWSESEESQEEPSDDFSEFSVSSIVVSWVEMATDYSREFLLRKTSPKTSEGESIQTQKIAPVILAERLGKSQKLECQMFIKCDYLNPFELSSSSMVDPHLAQDRLSRGKDVSVLTSKTIEFAIALAMSCANKGLPPPKFVVPLGSEGEHEIPDNEMSILNGLGADIVTLPVSMCDGPEAVGKESGVVHQNDNEKREQSDNHSVLVDKFNKELIEQVRQLIMRFEGQFDVLVLDLASAKLVVTSWKFTGIEGIYDIIGVDPNNGIMYHFNNADVTNPKMLGGRVTDSMATTMWHALVNEAGILCSKKSGRVMGCAVQAVKELKQDCNPEVKVVTLLPESIVHDDMYLLGYDSLVRAGTLSDFQIESNNYWWWNETISDIGLKGIGIVPSSMTVKNAIELMSEGGIDRLVILGGEGQKVTGVVFLDDLIDRIELVCADEFDAQVIAKLENECLLTVMNTGLDFCDIETAKMKHLATLFVTADYLVLTGDSETLRSSNSSSQANHYKESLIGILSSEEVVDYKNKIIHEHLNQGFVIKG